MTETEIANLAISLIGGKSLTALLTDNTPQAVTCRKWFDPARDEALASHPWNFATKRWRNEIAWTALSGVALADNGSGLIRVTHNTHSMQTGDRIHMRNVQGVPAANGTWYITRITQHTFDLQDSVFSGSHTSGTGEWILAPLFGWDYQHTLPADCLRVVNVNGFEANENDSVPYAVELGKLLTNEDIVTLRYVYKNETQTEWSQHFINAFALLLASYIAQDLTGPSGTAELRGRFEQQIGPKAKGQDARQGKGRVIDPDYDSRVVRARRNFL
jgi:hypothetical protein